MTGLDSNVLVRYIMQDGPAQSAKATALIESLTAIDPGFIPLVHVVELYWVLTSCYALSDAQVAGALDVLVRTKQFVVERVDVVVRALRLSTASTCRRRWRRSGEASPIRRGAPRCIRPRGHPLWRPCGCVAPASAGSRGNRSPFPAR